LHILFLRNQDTCIQCQSMRIHKEARDGKLTWDQVLTMVINEYLAWANVQNTTKWAVLQDKKEDTEIKAMKAEIKSLQDQIKNLKMELQHKAMTTHNANAHLVDHYKNLTCHKCKN